jgi:hypothetical protein
MKTPNNLVLVVLVLLFGRGATPHAASQPTGVAQAGQPARVAACKLLSKEEVKKILPWQAMFDQMPIEEDPIGTTGSSCNYPSATIQILAYTQRFFDGVRTQGKLEPIAGVGDEALFFANPRGYAELYVKAGDRIVTVQANTGPKETIESLKPGVITLAKALIAKLR